MPEKVRRGLGLLTVAVIALLVGLVTSQSESMPAELVTSVAGLTVVVSAGVGLVMVAVGLLRD